MTENVRGTKAAGDRPSVSIFLSHKAEDYDVAKVIRDNLEGLSAGKIQFHLSEELPKGDDWYEWIETNLGKANWFMLLFTDPSNEWDWCLYEAGLFRGIGNKDGVTRLICLHDKCVKVPEQLTKFQNVCAEKEDMLFFLKKLFVEPVDGLEPIHPKLIDNPILIDTAEKICKEIRGKLPPPEPQKSISHFQKYLMVSEYTNGKGIEDGTHLLSNSYFRDIFRINVLPETWGEFKKMIKEVADEEEDKQGKNIDLSWIDEIESVMRKAKEGFDFDQPKSAIQGLGDEKLYKPVLISMSTVNQGQDLYRDFHLIFIDDNASVEDS